jgi:hypothetical protein
MVQAYRQAVVSIALKLIVSYVVITHHATSVLYVPKRYVTLAGARHLLVHSQTAPTLTNVKPRV